MVRTRHLLEGTSPISNYQYLSGLLIGSELIELVKTSCSIIVVSEEPLLKLYLHALEVLDMKQRVNSLSARQAFINGQCELAAMLAMSIQ
jgi:2-keto-3-deoxy-galactonokinase